jgi:hypothetical protein
MKVTFEGGEKALIEDTDWNWQFLRLEMRLWELIT